MDDYLRVPIALVPQPILDQDVALMVVDQAPVEVEVALRELKQLQIALDAHAIVAITDHCGVILRVNDKFCQISQYSRHELIGRTHAIINSGYHPPEFFDALWVTIAAGHVWSGEICNRAKDGSLYWVATTIIPQMNAMGRPEQYIAIRANITERKQAEQVVQHMALYDALTDLPNRRLLIEQLQLFLKDANRQAQCAAFIIFDLDHFMRVNDNYGYHAGDLLLKSVANRLGQLFHENVTVARLGGDEFVVLLTDLGTDFHLANGLVMAAATRILTSINEPHVVCGKEVPITASLGVVMLAGGTNVTEDGVLKQAHMSLSQAKEGGRNQICFCDPVLQAEIAALVAMEDDLRHAVNRQQLKLFYQPLVDQSRIVVGYEALLRWFHPEHGTISPAVFIPVAERTGAILSIGNWVLQEACCQLVRWASEPGKGELTISVNVSPRQFQATDFVDTVLDTIAKTGASPWRLKLELTESMLLDDLAGITLKMHALGQCGVRFSLDDFGTGYSSLRYLKLLPLSQLKIDQSFVKDLETNPSDIVIAQAIVQLAKSLTLQVVAEGVENTAQLDILRGFGCQYFQGYLFGRPALLT